MTFIEAIEAGMRGRAIDGAFAALKDGESGFRADFKGYANADCRGKIAGLIPMAGQEAKAAINLQSLNGSYYRLTIT